MRKAVDNSWEEETPIRICQTAVELPPIRTAADSSFEVTICDLKNYANGVKSCEKLRHLCAIVQQLWNYCLCAAVRVSFVRIGDAYTHLSNSCAYAQW